MVYKDHLKQLLFCVSSFVILGGCRLQKLVYTL